MDQPTKPTDWTAIALGILTSGIGVLFLLIAAGIVAPGGKSATHGNDFGVFCVGLIFSIGGIAVIVQSAAIGTRGTDSEASAAPNWARRAMQCLGFIVIACMGLLASWIAFGLGTREFQFSIPFIGQSGAGEPVGRAIFGLSAILIWATVLAMSFAAVRNVFGKRRDGFRKD
jgi:hypothetical protein